LPNRYRHLGPKSPENAVLCQRVDLRGNLGPDIPSFAVELGPE
jgi:hypothetical protein